MRWVIGVVGTEWKEWGMGVGSKNRRGGREISLSIPLCVVLHLRIIAIFHKQNQ